MKTCSWWAPASIGGSVSPATPNFSPNGPLSAQEELLLLQCVQVDADKPVPICRKVREETSHPILTLPVIPAKARIHKRQGT
jgi:hypothetical protein